VIGPVNPIAGDAVTVTIPEPPGAMEMVLGFSVSVTGLVTPSISGTLVDPP